jgi:hypothetical protein
MSAHMYTYSTSNPSNRHTWTHTVRAAIAWSWLPCAFCLRGSPESPPCPIRGRHGWMATAALLAESDGGGHLEKVPPYPQFLLMLMWPREGNVSCRRCCGTHSAPARVAPVHSGYACARPAYHLAYVLVPSVCMYGVDLHPQQPA